MMNEIERGQLAIDTVQCFTTGEGSLSILPDLIKRVIEERVWERRMHHGQLIELPNLRALITEKPVRGWGQDPKKIEAVIKDDPQALSMFREAMLQESGKRTDLGNNVTDVDRVTGNSRAYSIARVQKACDRETVADVMAGRMSPHAALVKAGVRKKTITVPCEPEGFAAAIRRHLTDEQIAKVVALLLS